MKVATVCLAIVALVGNAAAVSYPSQTCPTNEVLVASPPCCEPTCDCDCDYTSCQQLLVYQPTCVCMTGYVRFDGECVPKSCCPVPETEPPCPTTTAAPVYQPPSCGCGQNPCHCAQPAYQPAPVYNPAPVYQPCETTQAPVVTTTCSYQPAPPAPVYEQPSCGGCGQYPCQCAQPAYQPAPVYQPCETTQAPVVTTTCSYQPAPVYEQPSCGGCGQTPCHCAQPAYQPAPVYEQPSCGGCGQYPCQCAQPAPVYQPCETTTVYTTPACETPKPPTCAPCEQLVFAHPCCEPTCDNDCSGVHCNPLLLVEEPTCACRPGLVRYQGHCVEPSVCPRSASRYRLFVPKTVSCACNKQNVVVY
ncbi:keratin-associated protein 9-1-like [Anopheles moucheti]|uniref:keratin-associated protein 9-1-like n=1 Tax=Anopheles moucheti TaxID=186751 RepID=UPI0022F08F2A|nr:keratin-associated protein 9-1-like [Anopheles moucheti]